MRHTQDPATPRRLLRRTASGSWVGAAGASVCRRASTLCSRVRPWRRAHHLADALELPELSEHEADRLADAQVGFLGDAVLPDHAEQQAVVRQAWIVDVILVGQQTAHEHAELEQDVPVAPVARQPAIPISSSGSTLFLSASSFDLVDRCARDKGEGRVTLVQVRQMRDRSPTMPQPEQGLGSAGFSM